MPGLIPSKRASLFHLICQEVMDGEQGDWENQDNIVWTGPRSDLGVFRNPRGIDLDGTLSVHPLPRLPLPFDASCSNPCTRLSSGQLSNAQKLASATLALDLMTNKPRPRCSSCLQCGVRQMHAKLQHHTEPRICQSHDFLCVAVIV